MTPQGRAAYLYALPVAAGGVFFIFTKIKIILSFSTILIYNNIEDLHREEKFNAMNNLHIYITPNSAKFILNGAELTKVKSYEVKQNNDDFLDASVKIEFDVDGVLDLEITP